MEWKLVVFVLIFFSVEIMFMVVKFLSLLVFFFFIVIFVYSRLCSFELDYYIVSSGEIFIVNVFDDYLFGYCRG